jgi:hypothetical protein
MKRLYILAFLLMALVPFVGSAQYDFGFTYDSSGNRHMRSVIPLKNAVIPPDSLHANRIVKAIEDQIGLQKALIYPNPTKGLLRIQLPCLAEQEATISVFDLNGKLMIQKTAVESNNEVNLSSYPSGFYIMTILVGKENRKEWKIIKD